MEIYQMLTKRSSLWALEPNVIGHGDTSALRRFFDLDPTLPIPGSRP